MQPEDRPSFHELTQLFSADDASSPPPPRANGAGGPRLSGSGYVAGLGAGGAAAGYSYTNSYSLAGQGGGGGGGGGGNLPHAIDDPGYLFPTESVHSSGGTGVPAAQSDEGYHMPYGALQKVHGSAHGAGPGETAETSFGFVQQALQDQAGGAPLGQQVTVWEAPAGGGAQLAERGGYLVPTPSSSSGTWVGCSRHRCGGALPSGVAWCCLVLPGVASPQKRKRGREMESVRARERGRERWGAGRHAALTLRCLFCCRP